MIVFVTSVRHPHNCNDYDRVLTLLRQTLHSVCAQEDSNFRVVVVCNRRPVWDFSDRVDFVEVNFPPPSSVARPNTGMEAIQIDRGSKYMVGVNFARRFSPHSIMFFDADDLISNRIAGFVNRDIEKSAWYFPRGYKMRQGSSSYHVVHLFYRHCGSSAVQRIEALDIPEFIDEKISLTKLVASVSSYKLRVLFGTHAMIKRHYEKHTSISISPLPFPGSIWLLGTGENHSGRKGSVEGDLISAEMRTEFSIPEDW